MTKQQLEKEVKRLEQDLQYSRKFIAALILMITEYNQRQTNRDTLVEFFHGK